MRESKTSLEAKSYLHRTFFPLEKRDTIISVKYIVSLFLFLLISCLSSFLSPARKRPKLQTAVLFHALISLSNKTRCSFNVARGILLIASLYGLRFE